jgi:hypothetical protein
MHEFHRQVKKALKQDNVDLFMEKIIKALDDVQITQSMTRQTSLNKVFHKNNIKNKRLKDLVQNIMTDAVKLGSLRILKYLIDILGVDPNVVNRGRTLLRWAALQEKPSLEMVRYLLDHPRIDLQSDAATLPFDIMFIIGGLQDDARTYWKDKLRGMIYPHYRIRKYTEILLLFLEKVLTRDPKYVNQQDHYGKTLLWVAAHYGLSNVVELLLSYGADYTKDYNQKTTSKGTLNRGGGGAQAPKGTNPLQETLRSKRGNWNRCQQLLTQVEKFNTLAMSKQLWDASHMYNQQKSRHGEQVAREKLLGSTYRSAASVSHKFPIVWAAASTQQQKQEQETKKKTGAVLRYMVKRMKNQHVIDVGDLLGVNHTRAPRILNPSYMKSIPYITNQEIQRIKAIRRYLSENPPPDQLSDPQKTVIRKARRTIRAKNPDNSEKKITKEEKLEILIQAYSELLQQEYLNDQRWKDVSQLPYDGPLLSLGGGGGGGN